MGSVCIHSVLYAADNGQIPEALKKGAAEHDPCGTEQTAQFKQKKNFGYLCRAVIVTLQKKAFLANQEKIADKDLIQKHQEYGRD